MSQIADEINKSWHETFRILFGTDCKHNLEELSEWLFRDHYPPMYVKSSISGKPVTLCSTRYSKTSKFISQEEISYSRKHRLDINKIKDIDSILEAIEDRAYYAGNKIFGSTTNSESCDNITDCHYAYHSSVCSQSKQLGYSSYARDNSEYSFGSEIHSKGKYLIRVLGAAGLARCFESYIITNSSDLFYTFDCSGCDNAMFSFGLRSKRYCIGNLPLEKSKYLPLKKKLTQEAAEYINKHKTFPSVYDFPPPDKSKIKPLSITPTLAPKMDFKPIDEAFETATKVILGKPLSPVKNYRKFLTKRSDAVQIIKTIFGSEGLYSKYSWYRAVPHERAITMAEAREMESRHITLSESENLGSILKKCEAIAFYAVDFKEGQNTNNSYTQVEFNAINSYMCGDVTYSKNAAFDTMAFHSEAVFGCFRAIHSKYSIRCHDCFQLTACMDMDSCSYCSNSMFCHNCENLENCMFCFNAKSLKYAIGNVEVGKEKYAEIKKKICDEILAQIEKNGDLGFDICDLGCKK
ncbi:hypothetical protein COU37_00340 [Candidatus Micrarchaeota archaeon CG10_big_fil_rev_8_21_14_0_10_45_29]|nr:MAG: hypothetical protein COU37_00340 [Candidatus Micrarchaeota archaeon CG10_big_fil_rev_8_21_14_0_10_45_29]